MVRHGRVEHMLRRIGRNPELSGADQISEHLADALQSQLAGHPLPKTRPVTLKEVTGMLSRKKIAAAVVIVVLASIAAALFLHPGQKTLPTFTQLVEASEVAMTGVHSLYLEGEQTTGEGTPTTRMKIWVNDPIGTRMEHDDGHFWMERDSTVYDYDKKRNVFRIHKAMGQVLTGRPTELYVQESMLGQLQMGAQAAGLHSDVKVEETEFRGKKVWVANLVVAEKDLTDKRTFAMYFDCATGLLMRMEVAWPNKGLTGTIDVIQVNPHIPDSLFSIEPPEGAKVVDMSEGQTGGH